MLSMHGNGRRHLRRGTPCRNRAVLLDPDSGTSPTIAPVPTGEGGNQKTVWRNAIDGTDTRNAGSAYQVWTDLYRGYPEKPGIPAWFWHRKRVTQRARIEDCTILTRIAWRTQWYAGTGRRHSSPHLLAGVSCLYEDDVLTRERPATHH